MDTRTAKDLPIRAEVHHCGVTYLKGQGLWVSDSPDPPNFDITDDDIDKVLAAGGVIVRDPAGRRL
jgi:hypothetical protein